MHHTDQERDLATPLSRLIGHWASVPGGHELYYTQVDSSAEAGICILNNRGAAPSCPITFEVVRHDAAGEGLVIRESRSFGDLEAHTGISITMSLTTISIPKHGRSMVQDYTFCGVPLVREYRYVDDRTAP